MNREILFRGKRLDNGEWAEGFYMEVQHVKDKSHVHTFILQKDKCLETGGPPDFMVEVDPSTVGQYTGLTDKNGVKIFEGDLVRTHYANAKRCDFVEQVVFDGGRFCGLYLSGRAKQWTPLPSGTPHIVQDKSVYMDWCEVIGNIHENPGLMEENHDG